MADGAISKTTQTTTTTTTTTGGKPPADPKDTQQKLDNFMKALEKLLDEIMDKGEKAAAEETKKAKEGDNILALLEKLASGEIDDKGMDSLSKATGISKEDLGALKGGGDESGGPTGG